MQWSADITKHAHIEDIKVPARAGNTQNYYMQIVHHLDWLEKCFLADLGDSCDDDEDHEPNTEKQAITNYLSPIHLTIDYFSISSALICRSCSSAPKPFRMFATNTTAFRLAAKPSLRLTLEEAIQKYGLPDLASAAMIFLGQECSADLRLQVWQKVCIQQATYHNKSILDSPQTLCAISPTTTNLFRHDWPKYDLEGHSVAQIRIIFRFLSSDLFLAYVQHFHTIPQGNPTNTSALTGMHLLKRTV
ncbi:hypothetical protein L210DRAFT_961204 [Boletus edulis BED1]|uniref:DUF6830 domain-containing protein n=1 Tax=Boletus edulis BED1 TaxID=1328754 RepID=A0AAD4BJA5_BOLED|nr:hypothetical protein L210DRAFT_961204 [Boletus edulis BED1]